MNRMSRIELLTALNQMLPGQFDMVVSLSGVPPQYLSASSASQATRAGEVVRYFKSRLGGLNDLAGVVDQVRGSAGAPPTHQGGGQTIINKESIGQQINVQDDATFTFSGPQPATPVHPRAVPASAPTAHKKTASTHTSTSDVPVPNRIFISYSDDSDEHRTRVLNLAQRLRADRQNCQIDDFLNGSRAEGWPQRIKQQIEDADFVLVVCTESYHRHYQGEKGVGKELEEIWEAVLARQDLNESQGVNKKFIPVIFDGGDIANIPKPLQPFTRYHLSEDYDGLLRHLTSQSAAKPKPIDPKKVLPPDPS